MRLEALAYKSHITLLASVLEQRISLKNIRDKLTTTRDSVRENAKEQVHCTNDLIAKVKDAATTLGHILETAASIYTTVMSFRSLGIQLIQIYIASILYPNTL